MQDGEYINWWEFDNYLYPQIAMPTRYVIEQRRREEEQKANEVEVDPLFDLREKFFRDLDLEREVSSKKAIEIKIEQQKPLCEFQYEWDSDEEMDQLAYVLKQGEEEWLREIQRQDVALQQRLAKEEFKIKQSMIAKEQLKKENKRCRQQRRRQRKRARMDQKREQLEMAMISDKWHRARKVPRSKGAAKVDRTPQDFSAAAKVGRTPRDITGAAVDRTPLDITGAAKVAHTPLDFTGTAVDCTPLDFTGAAVDRAPDFTGAAVDHTPLDFIGDLEVDENGILALHTISRFSHRQNIGFDLHTSYRIFNLQVLICTRQNIGCSFEFLVNSVQFERYYIVQIVYSNSSLF